MMIDLQLAPAVVVFIIIAREFIVTALRLIAAPKGVVIAADRWGKYKTVSQMAWIILGLLMLAILHNFGQVPSEAVVYGLLVANDVMMVTVTALTVFSGCNYLWANKAVIADVK
jgi:CDP-diacylglycerol--glycerol-3-phosphate 3-phosphatidyltransferase